MCDHPVISCICITRAKPWMLQRAIDCFTAQSYKQKELIVVYEDDDIAMEHFVDTYKNSIGENIRFICVNASPKLTLGELRNIGIDKATGTFICQWDDDDWCHVNRLDYQYNVIRNTSYKASVMTQWLVFDAIKGNAYISNKRLWEGSLLCCKSLIGQKQYEHVAMGEDTPVIDFLKSSNHIYEITSCPNLYIYVYHGCNTWHLQHWEEIFKCSKYLGNKISQEIAMVLNGEYQHKEASEIVDWLLQETTI